MSDQEQSDDIRCLTDGTHNSRDRALVAQSSHPSNPIAASGRPGAPQPVASITSLRDIDNSLGRVANQLELARLRLQLLMADAEEERNGCLWLALNDAAHCVQRALASLGTVAVSTAPSSLGPATAAR